MDLDPNGEIFTFEWNGDEQRAIVLAYEDDEYVKLQWEDEEDEKHILNTKLKLQILKK